MLRLLADEDFNRDIVRGLVRCCANVDIVRVQEVGLRTADDPTILQWAADYDRIVVTHDRATMKGHAGDRLAAELAMPGVLVLDESFPVGPAIEELSLLCECSDHYEWIGRIVFLPL